MNCNGQGTKKSPESSRRKRTGGQLQQKRGETVEEREIRREKESGWADSNQKKQKEKGKKV